MSDQDEIFRVQESVVPQLLTQPGVTGVGVGFREKDGKPTDEIVIRVYVQDKRPLAEVPAELRIPSEIGGFKTDVIQKGPDVPCAFENYKGRPLVSGLEISRALSGGGFGKGTIGCFVSDILPDNIRSRVGQPGYGCIQHVYLLSASHVLNPTENTVDGLVHQPRPAAYMNRVAETLKDRCVWSGAVDAGLARLDAEIEWKNDVHNVGTIDGIRRVTLGETVSKQGVTTGLTSRRVEDINYFTNLPGNGARFGPAIEIRHNSLRDPFIAPGDSGALVWVSDDNPQGGKLLRAVGLVSLSADTHATVCHLDTVFERLKIEFPLTKAGKGNNNYSWFPGTEHAVPSLEQQQTVEAHNGERKKYPGVGPLQWSPELAQYAQEWAERLAERDPGAGGPFREDLREIFRENSSDNPFRPGERLGQNIYGARGLVTRGPDAVQVWIREKERYDYDRDDGKGKGGEGTGEFKQVIWKATQFVGCGKAKSAHGSTYIVCNYYPEGRVWGQKPY